MTTRRRARGDRRAGPRRRRPGELPGTFWVLWFGVLINMTGGVVETFLAAYLVSLRGFSVPGAGLVVAVMGGCTVVSQLVGGILSDRWGATPTMVLSALAQGVAVIGLGLATSTAAVFVLAVAVGLTREMYRPATNSLVATVVPGALHRRAFGLLYWAVNLGWSIALIGGGRAAEIDFVWIFRIDAVSCLVFALVATLSARERSPGPRSSLRRGLGAAGRDGLLRWYATTVAVFTMVSLLGMTALPLAMTREGISTGAVGAVLAVNGVAAVGLQPFVSRWVERVDAGTVLALAAVVVGIGYAATSAADTPLQYGVTVLVWSGGEILAAAHLAAVVPTLAGPELLGVYSGVMGMAWSVGLAAAPLFGTVLLARGDVVLWNSALLVALLVAASFFAMRRSLAERAGSVAELRR